MCAYRRRRPCRIASKCSECLAGSRSGCRPRTPRQRTAPAQPAASPATRHPGPVACPWSTARTAASPPQQQHGMSSRRRRCRLDRRQGRCPRRQTLRRRRRRRCRWPHPLRCACLWTTARTAATKSPPPLQCATRPRSRSRCQSQRQRRPRRRQVHHRRQGWRGQGWRGQGCPA